VDVNGTNASELLNGTSADDVVTGLGGNDSLRGGDGNDIYIFSGVFGRDVIRDQSGVDRVRIGADYGPGDFRVSLNFDDLLISQVNGPQVITLETFSSTVRYGGIEAVVFDRTGTVWDVASGAIFRTAGITGTSAAELLNGSVYDDVLLGLGGNDSLRGGDGNDAYVFYGAFGQDVVRDQSGVDRVRIGSDYSERDFRYALRSDDLLISQVNGPQSITLETFGSAIRFGGIDSVLFERTGTVWDVASGQVVVRPGFFDYDGYLAANPDVRAAGIGP
jgi:Ca2+-binding RTX toxin-like protein